MYGDARDDAGQAMMRHIQKTISTIHKYKQMHTHTNQYWHNTYETKLQTKAKCLYEWEEE